MRGAKVDKYIRLSVGIPENGHEDYLFLELVVGPYEIELDRSANSLDGMTDSDFILAMEDLLNTATIFSRNLNLKINVDVDGIVSEAQELELSEKAYKNIMSLIQEVL
jgi:hypothetical protein